MRRGLGLLGTICHRFKSIMPSAKLAPLNFNLDAASIVPITKAAIEKANIELDAIGRIDGPKFSDAMARLAQLEADIQISTAATSFLQHVSSDIAIRDASVEAQMLLDAFYIDKGMREDVYAVTKKIQEAEGNALEGDKKWFLEKVILGFKQNGLGLDQEKRELLKEKRKRLADLCTEFSRNLNEDTTSVSFTAEQLDGCTSDFLESLSKTEDGKFIVTTKYPDVAGVMQYAKNEETRKAVDISFNTRASINSPLLEEAIRLRFECAQLLGYATHADFQLEDRLAKTRDAVLKFELDLKEKLTPLGAKELERLRGLKLAETGSESFRTWDLAYFSRILKEREYSVDQELLKEYFSLETVLKSMLEIYEEVLGLKFNVDASIPVWHEDVKAVRVTNACGGSEVGLFYLDLFPRDGKYSHAACFPMSPGYVDIHGNRNLPVSAIVANFTKPTSDKPSLLKHDEVTTFFHELGHAMHDMCALATFSRFSGTSVETDFVEAPSQMLENWCWDKATLKRLSKHFKTGEPLSDELIANLVRSKHFNDGLHNLRQVFFGLFDLTIHSITSKNGLSNGETIDQLYSRLRREISLLQEPEGVCPAASFGHMMGGYDSGYYGYLWSEVFSADMFASRFEAEGLQNPQVGMSYRREILQPGGSRDGIESIKAFLGREPTPDAFLRSIGL